MIDEDFVIIDAELRWLLKCCDGLGRVVMIYAEL